MILSRQNIKKSILAKGYKWFTDQPNIVLIRTTIDVPDVFNDYLTITWMENGVENYKIFQITTDPGMYWLEYPENKLGTAVLVPKHYIGTHALGFHKGRSDHEALVQVAPVSVYRNPDRDGTRDSDKWKIDTGMFGINIHGSNKITPSKIIGKWSAGCQVFANWLNKQELIRICKLFKTVTKNRFSFTLLNESDILNS